MITELIICYYGWCAYATNFIVYRNRIEVVRSPIQKHALTLPIIASTD